MSPSRGGEEGRCGPRVPTVTSGVCADQARADVGSSHQRKQAAAGHAAEEVDDSRDQCERRPDAEAEKGHRRHFEILEGEDDDGCNKQHDDCDMNPAHGESPVSE